MMRQKNLKAKEKLRPRRTEVNLNFLRNDLDIWHRQVNSWIDIENTIPPKDVIKKLGIKVVQKLYIRRVLNKRDIDEMKLPELPLTPRRSGSASLSPNRPTTPDSITSRRSKSIRRVSPKDLHSDCQEKLDFNDDEDGYKTAKNEYFELLANEYVKKFRDLKNIVDSKHIDGCPKCTLRDEHTQRYRAERNELREDNQRLEKILTTHAKVKQQHMDIESKFQHEVSNLKIQNRRADKKVANAEKELEDMTTKCKEQQSKYNSKRCQLESEITELQLELDEMRKFTEYRCNETRKIATERTIASLQQEKHCLEQELINARAKLDQIQSDLKLFKTKQVHQQDSSNGTIDDLLQQNRKLEDDKELLREKVCSLENDKIKSEDIFEHMYIRLSEKDKELKHLKSILNIAKFKNFELEEVLNCESSMSDIAEKNKKIKQNLRRLYDEIDDIVLTALMSERRQKVSKETSMSTGEGTLTTGTADAYLYNFSENNESGGENSSSCSGNQLIMSSSSNFNSTRHIVSEQHRTININANTVQISDNASITMSSNTSVDENRRQCEVDEPENQQHLEIEN